MKNILLKLAYYILDKYKVNYFIYPEEKLQVLVNQLVDQVESKFKGESGEFKRAQVMRAALNIPGVTERQVALAIEMAINKS